MEAMVETKIKKEVSEDKLREKRAKKHGAPLRARVIPAVARRPHVDPSHVGRGRRLRGIPTGYSRRTR